MKIKLIYILFFVTLFGCEKDEGRFIPKSTQYKVLLNLNWNSNDFPVDYPSDPHFSRVVGWSHNSNSSFFKEGFLASKGIKAMAERGEVSPLDIELDSLINTGIGHQSFVGNFLPNGTGVIELEEVEVTKDFSKLGLVSMLAPSPDWYVGAIDVELVDNNEFLSEMTVDLVIYDAGTDSGVSFESSDSLTFPQKNISKFVSSPLGNGVSINKVIGTVRFVKQVEK